MLTNQQSFCHGPFIRAFVLPNGLYRDCCATVPALLSQDYDFDQWWFNNNNFNKLRKKLLNTQSFPAQCSTCRISEQASNTSFRLSLNKIPITKELAYPKEWSIMFGNICNLACWHCSEDFSSRIENDKLKINVLPENFKSPAAEFELRWPALKNKILQSYEHHNIVTLSLLGGEPTYNKIVIDFLIFLYENNLSNRTRLEITTNGTRSSKLSSILTKENWNYIYVAISIDAVGAKAEWLRYGCNWNEIDRNIDYYIEKTNYVELHSTVSILNIFDLPDLSDYSKNKKVNLIVNYLKSPSYLALEHYDGPAVELNEKAFLDNGYIDYYHLLGTNPITGSYDQAKLYIKSFESVRNLNVSFDPMIVGLVG